MWQLFFAEFDQVSDQVILFYVNFNDFLSYMSLKRLPEALGGFLLIFTSLYFFVFNFLFEFLLKNEVSIVRLL